MNNTIVKFFSSVVACAFLFASALPVQASEVLNPPIKAATKKKSKKAGFGKSTQGFLQG